MAVPPPPTALPVVPIAEVPSHAMQSIPYAAGRARSTAPTLLRRLLAVICVLGIPIISTALTEYGQYMETRLEGGSYKHGYAIAWLNHSVLIVFLVPWAMIVVAEKGCSCVALWRAMIAPYGSGRRLAGVTFWLAFQYQLFNYGYWSWLPLASAASAQTISQSQCIFAVLFAGIILKEPVPALRVLLVLLCVVGVCVLTYGDIRRRDSRSTVAGSAGSSAEIDGSGSTNSSEREGSMLGDILLIIPSAFNALYAVEWKRLVPGVQARDSLVGLGLLAAWHLVFWIWGMVVLNVLHYRYDVHWAEPFALPNNAQAQALGINAAIATAGNFCFMMGTTVLPSPVPIVVANAVAVPLTYCYDIVFRSIHFSTVSLLGAAIVVVSFVMLNLYEMRMQSAAAKQKARNARLRRAHTLEDNLLLETSPRTILQSFYSNPPSLPGDSHEANLDTSAAAGGGRDSGLFLHRNQGRIN